MSSTETADGSGAGARWPAAPARPTVPTSHLGSDGRASRTRAGLERALDRLPFLEKEMPVVAGIVEPGWICLDIGAAGGTYTHILSRSVGPRGRVLAVEPRSRSMRYLRRFRAWLRWHNVELHQVALADSEGAAELQVPRFARTEAHLVGHGPTDRTVRAETVTTTTVDALVRISDLPSVDLIKCDVEGAELQVLGGAEETVARFRPVLVVEIEARHLARYGSDPADVLAWFRARDYVPHRIRAGCLVPVDGVLPEENDYVLLPRERMDGP